ncbi:hypothetical protein COO60DRAFT_1510272 [Scenedesmus sp. NREL 46B-D3]|nr:hypothetical protein COO60DRAFT_1510272 [Scenedesmus sp. NREL 46B-D3]
MTQQLHEHKLATRSASAATGSCELRPVFSYLVDCMLTVFCAAIGTYVLVVVAMWCVAQTCVAEYGCLPHLVKPRVIKGRWWASANAKQEVAAAACKLLPGTRLNACCSVAIMGAKTSAVQFRLSWLQTPCMLLACLATFLCMVHQGGRARGDDILQLGQ